MEAKKHCAVRFGVSVFRFPDEQRQVNQPIIHISPSILRMSNQMMDIIMD
jgi:hypothetical protein